MNIATLLAPAAPPAPRQPARRHIGTFVAPYTPFPVASPAQCAVLVPRAVAHHVLDHGAVFGSGPYTDDSDVVLAALHSGRLPKPSSKARVRDALVELRVLPKSNITRFVGTTSQSGLSSRSWHGVHDGGSFEVLSARWLDDPLQARADAAARSLARRASRKQRMDEYTARRLSVLGRAVTRGSADHPSLTFPAGHQVVGYAFDPSHVRDTLFASHVPNKQHPRRAPDAAALEPFQHPDDRPDVIFRCHSPNSTTVVFRLEQQQQQASQLAHSVLAPVNGPARHVGKRKRSPAAHSLSSVSNHTYTVILRQTSTPPLMLPENALPFEDPPTSRDEQVRRFGGLLAGSASPPSGPGGGPRWASTFETIKKASVPPSPDTVVESTTSSDDAKTVFGPDAKVYGDTGKPVVVYTALEDESLHQRGQIAVLHGVRESDVEVLPDGIALWMDGRVCYLPVRSWSTRNLATAPARY